MSNVLRATIGSIVPIRVRTRERRSDAQDGRGFAANAYEVQDIKDASGTTIGATNIPVFTHVTDSEYVAHWDTSGLSAGDYTVVIGVTTGFDTVTQTGFVVMRRVIIRLLGTGVP